MDCMLLTGPQVEVRRGLSDEKSEFTDSWTRHTQAYSGILMHAPRMKVDQSGRAWATMHEHLASAARGQTAAAPIASHDVWEPMATDRLTD